MERITEVEIAGTKYPLNFSLKAAKEVSEKYDGDISKIATVLTGEDLMVAMAEMIWLLELLISQGVEYMRITESEERKGITIEELEVVVCAGDFVRLNVIAMNAITNGMSREVEVEPDPKNEMTTQDK